MLHDPFILPLLLFSFWEVRVYNGMIHLHAYFPSVVSVRNPFSELDGALRLATVDGGNIDMVYFCAVVGDSIEYAHIRSSGLPWAAVYSTDRECLYPNDEGWG